MKGTEKQFQMQENKVLCRQQTYPRRKATVNLPNRREMLTEGLGPQEGRKKMEWVTEVNRPDFS